MATLTGFMENSNFSSFVTNYTDHLLLNDQTAPLVGGFKYSYYGDFNYEPNSPMNEDTFLGGVVHDYTEMYYNDPSNPEDLFEISSFSLDYSEFQNANFDPDILLPKILVGNDVIDGGNFNGYAGNDVIYGPGVSVTLTGGTGNDTFYIAAKSHIVENIGEGYDRVVSTVTFSLKGADLEALALTGSAAIGAVGNTLANKLVGNDAGNKMQGLAGNDALYGGLGRDALYGGSGNDSFVFDTAPDTSNLDVIYDFAKVTGDHDTIRLDHTVFAALTQTGRLADEAFALIGSATATVSGNAHILYNASNGALYYDADGGDASGRLQFAVLSNHAALTHQDFLVI